MPDLLQELTNALEARADSWRSVEAVVHVDQEINLPGFPGPTVDRIDERYIETATGQRFYERRSHMVDGGTQRSIDYCDGRRCADLSFKPDQIDRQHQVVIKRDFSMERVAGAIARPVPLNFDYVGSVPLREALKDAKVVGEEPILGRDCVKVLFRDVKHPNGPRLAVYTLDRAEAVPLAVAFYLDPGHYESGTPEYTWRATALETLGGRLVPKTSVKEVFNSGGEGLTARVESTVKEISFDRDYPRSEFWPTLQPGVLVIDQIARTRSVVPGEVSEATTAQPIRADGGPSGGIPYAGISLGIGAAVLLAAFAVYRRRR
jgi:hypothetical protein